MKHILSSLAIAAALVATPAFALDYNSAKTQGLVGERPDGYIGAVTSAPSADVVALVDSVNRQRKAIYQDTAGKNGQPLSTAEKIAAQQLKERLPAGQFYMEAGGGWKKK